MKPKYTPGPWGIYDSGFNVRICPDLGSNIPTPSAQFYAIATMERAHTDKQHEEMKANARLIAAAPDLLGQLKYVREVLINWLPDTSQELVAECDRVIAEAEGSEK